MKTNSTILAVVIALGQFGAASAMTTTAAAPQAKTAAIGGANIPEKASTTLASVGESSGPENISIANGSGLNSSTPAIGASYFGIVNGPGLSADNGGKTNSGDDPYVNNRLKLQYNVSQNIDAGIQPRYNVVFKKSGTTTVESDSWRLFVDLKNIVKTDTFSFSLTPRAYLPTKLKSMNKSMLVSPELIPVLNYSPKNSRFSFTAWSDAVKFFYSDPIASAGASDFDITGALEANYQITASLAAFAWYYPEYTSKTTAAITNSSLEFDIGMSYTLIKDWTLSPFLTSDPFATGDGGPFAAKNMAVNLLITGSIL